MVFVIKLFCCYFGLWRNNQVNGHQKAKLRLDFLFFFPSAFMTQNKLSIFVLFLLLEQCILLLLHSHQSEAPQDHATVNLLISSYLNPELINSHSG